MNSKWNPFNAVASGTYMINDVLREKNKIHMPVLSEDQKNELQAKMLDAFNTQETIKVKYYKDGNIYVKEGKITNIEPNKQKIVLNFSFTIFFSQIVEFF